MYILYSIYIFISFTLFYSCYFIKNKYDKHYSVLQKFDKNVTFFSIIKLSFSTFLSFFHMIIVLRVQNYINGFCITKVNKNIYDVQFVIQKKFIKFRIKVFRGPSKCLQILDTANNNDITSTLSPFFNYEIIPITVENQKFSDIDVYLSNGEVLNFSKDDYIKLN
jgi:hypothetical protein